MNTRWLLVVVLVPCLATPGLAGIIFGKKNKAIPKDRVPELIAIVKSDGDENKRANAADELRNYDLAAFPEIVPALIDVLLHDKKPAVRSDAAQSLGKLRPISQSAGLALEQAMAQDASMRVRLQARSALLSYHWNGYRSMKKDEPIFTNKEPPLADPDEKPQPEPRRGFIRRATSTAPSRVVPQPVSRPSPVKTTEPPLAPPLSGATPVPTPAPSGKGPELGPQLQ